jgi:hypothetical protein
MAPRRRNITAEERNQLLNLFVHEKAQEWTRPEMVAKTKQIHQASPTLKEDIKVDAIRRQYDIYMLNVKLSFRVGTLYHHGTRKV